MLIALFPTEDKSQMLVGVGFCSVWGGLYKDSKQLNTAVLNFRVKIIFEGHKISEGNI